RRADDGERAEHLPLRLRPDEEGDADEADRDADEPEPAHPDLAEKAEGDDGVEDRDGRLEDRREAGVDPRLAPGEQPERDRDVDDPDGDEPARVRPQFADGLAGADEGGDDHR